MNETETTQPKIDWPVPLSLCPGCVFPDVTDLSTVNCPTCDVPISWISIVPVSQLEAVELERDQWRQKAERYLRELLDELTDELPPEIAKRFPRDLEGSLEEVRRLGA